MLRILRRIRGNALNNGNSKLYMIYAVGEIMLVVIGILLALQIDNWNTNKQESKELHNYLRNIQNNLRADLIALEEIKVFRDSSFAYSQNYLRIANKDEITIDDFNTVENSSYKVYFDQYFKPRKSGFESLKNSGYIGKLNGTEIEVTLNDYYYIIDKIIEREESLNNTIENLELVAHTQNIQLRMVEIENKIKTNEDYFATHQKEIKELINNPSLKAANLRNTGLTNLFQNYRQSEQLAKDLISEIDILIEKN
jgi:hypothetical protein